MPRECVTNTLLIDDRMSVLWAPDLRRVQAVLLGLLEEEGVLVAELPMGEEEEEEEQRERPPTAGEVGPS